MYSAQSLGLTVMRSSGGEELVLCPFHSDSRPSAWYSEKKGLFYCAVCGVGYNIHQLAKILHLDLSELEEEPKGELEDFDLMDSREIFDYGEPFYHPYLKQRGISERIALEYALGWKCSAPQAAVLPITSVLGDLKGACYRYLNVAESGTRYKFFGETTPLWPMHHLSRMEGDTIIVCEGGFSAMRIATVLDRSGLMGNIFALLGAKANENIVTALRPFNAIVLYDNDFAGRRACKKLRQLHPTVNAWTLNKAPDDMSDGEVLELLARLYKRVRW